MCSRQQLYAGIAQRMIASTSRTLYGESDPFIPECGFFVEAKANEIAIHPMGVPMYAYHDYGVWFVWERRDDRPNVFFACEHSLEQALRTAATKMVTQNLRQGLSADVAVELHLLANAVATEPEVPMKLNRPEHLPAAPPNLFALPN